MTFEHLDDTEPFAPDARLRTDAKRRGSRLRRRRRVGVEASGAIVLLIALTLTVTTYEHRQVDSITRIDLTGQLDDPHTASTGAAAAPTDAINILVTGSDADATPLDGSAPGERTDTMVVLRIDRLDRVVSVLPLPRDLWLDIPGHGAARLNTAWELGGPKLLIDTIKADLGISINHYVGLSFEGFRRLVDVAGGIDVHVVAGLRDANTGFVADGPACVHLDGTSTLALVRSRHLAHLDADGTWQEDTGSDLDRIERQQVVGRLLATALLRQAPTPAAADALIATMADEATIDTSWSLTDMAGLVLWARGLDPAQDLVSVRLPTVVAYEGSAAVLHLEPATLDRVLAPFRGGPPAHEHDPVSGLAGTAVPLGDPAARVGVCR